MNDGNTASVCGSIGTKVADADYDRKLDELDRLLNDPDSPMDPSKVWMLLAEVSRHDCVDMPNADAILAQSGSDLHSGH